MGVVRALGPVVLCLLAPLVARAGEPSPSDAAKLADTRSERPLKSGVSEPEERLYGLTIESIRVIAAPSERVPELLLLSGLAEGRPYVGSEIRRAVKVLYQLGRFENVYVSGARVGNGVAVELVLPARPHVREVDLTGNDALSRARVEEALGLRSGAEVDVRTFPARRRRLEAEYRRIGYRSVAIGLAATRVDLEGNHDVTVRIDEGPRTRLGKVTLRGTPRLPPRWVSASLGLSTGDVLDLDRVRAAIEDLAADYRRRGFLEVTIGEPEVKEGAGAIDGEPAAELVLVVDAGPRVTVRFVGNEVVSIRELEEAASIMRTPESTAIPRSWSRTGPAALSEVRERILARYERRGLWSAEVRPVVRVSADRTRKEIIFAIKEGKGSYVASLGFSRTSTRGLVQSDILGDDALEEKVLEVVADTLSETVGAPGADPSTVEVMLGDRTFGKRAHKQPDSSSPNVRRIYVPRAYGAAARDAIGDLFRAEGYQDVVVQGPKVAPRTEKSELLDVRYEIDPGVRWVIGALSFAGNEAVPSSRLFDVGKLDPVRQGGEPINFYNMEESRRAILESYQNEGYLYARVETELREVPERGSLVSHELVSTSSMAQRVRSVCAEAKEAGRAACEVELVFRVAEGPQVRARNVVIRGVETTRVSLVESQLAVKAGEILRESDMLATRQNLLRIGVFERVMVRPLDEKTEAADKDVVVEVRERKHSAFEVGAGASTAEGVRAFAGYSHDNVFGTALRLQVDGKVNVQPFLILYDEATRARIERFYETFTVGQRIERELAIGLSYPRFFGLPPGFGAGLDLSFAHDLAPAYLQNVYAATLRFDYKGLRPVLSEKQRPVNLQLKLGFDFTELTCNAGVTNTSTITFDPSQRCTKGSATGATPDQSGTTIYGTAGPLVSVDLRDDPLDPRAGLYLELEASFAKTLATGPTDFFKLEGTANAYVPLAGRVGLAFSLYAGQIFRLENNGIVPVNRRFFAGGSKTVRGYAEQSLIARDYPKDEAAVANETETLSRGGLLVFALKNELRFPLTGALSGAFFYDVGDLFEVPANFALDEQTRQSVGVGLRYATPVGPLSLDVGFPLVVREAGEGGFTIHFSVRSF